MFDCDSLAKLAVFQLVNLTWDLSSYMRTATPDGDYKDD